MDNGMDDVISPQQGAVVNVEACPEECVFDWVDFVEKFDIALAHYIESSAVLPSRSSVTLFLEFISLKKHLQEEHPKKKKK